MSNHTIRIRDRVVVFTFAVVVSGLVAAVGVAVKAQHDLQTFRQQSIQIEMKLRELESSYAVIREYTGNFSSLAVPREKPWLKDLGEHQAAPQEVDFLSMSLSAKRGVKEPTDLDLYTRMLQTIDDLNRDSNRIVGRLNVMAVVLQNHKDLIRTIPSRIPVAGGRISSEFGSRLSPFGGKRSMHAGIDIAGEIGEPILAPADGTVTFSGVFDSLGYTVVLDHGSGVLTRYGHASKLLAKKGQKVKRGAVIAHVGNTGNSTGPHLHYEVWVHNRAVNPRNFFFDVTERPDDIASWHDTEGKPTGIKGGMGGD